ncbi:MAG: ECF RNA polymerase sigma factor SigK [Verrucomicrobia subdivision 3 bacterium]|nr:ECF RNA polymerase sigma factor SigK [Limisphaerales bacterium]MCS1414495.1 ECF RNA polymerase sigma factor SigK [Limisphaerales bacterium]
MKTVENCKPSDDLRAEIWKRWLKEHSAKLLLFARQVTRSAADAEDVVQNAIARQWGRDAAAMEPPMGLMICSIRRAAIDLGRSETRRQIREQHYSDSMLQEMGSFFEPDFEKADQQQLVQQAMEELSQPQREVIVLKVWGGLTYAEIASALELSINTVGSRYRYGLAALKKKLGVVVS